MKVVINNCFGGFSLSSEAMTRLIEEKSPIIEIGEEKDWDRNLESMIYKNKMAR